MDTNTTRKRDFLLGLIFFGTVGMLLYYTVILTGFSFSDKTYLQVSFPGASGLKTGDVVLVSGHQFGNVSSVSFRDDQPDDRRIYVEMEFDSPVTLRRGYQIQISEFTMLGGRVVEVFPGHFSSPILPDGVKLIGQVGPSALAAMGQLVSENRDDLRAIVSNLRTLTDNLKNGKGVVGSLLNDESLRDRMENIFTDVETVTNDIRSGKGTLGMLVEDDASRDRVVNLLRDGAASMLGLRVLVEEVAAGRGTMGALLMDEKLQEDSAALIENMRDTSDLLTAMLEDATKGRGLFGRIVADESLARDASAFLHDLAAAIRDVREGKGSIGKLVARDEAYEEAMQAVRTLNGLLEDAREAQPVSSFASMLFGATVGG
ncbi:MAG TPA: MlaD family protein [Planctomycetota bacterium]|nr:hypothetical protein [Planctomycetota bacterium]HJM40238.1 MlaD family protein [Planctomycetota bacterium]